MALSIRITVPTILTWLAFLAALPASTQELPSQITIEQQAASQLFGTGKTDLIAEKLEMAAEEARLKYGEEDVRYAEALLKAQMVAIMSRSLATIESNTKKALAIIEKVRGTDSLSAAHGYYSLGSLYALSIPTSSKNERLAEARRLLDRAANIYRAKLGPDASELVEVGKTLARVEQSARRPKDAEAHLRRALSILEKADKPDPRQMILVLYQLEELFRYEKNRIDEVESIHKRIISIDEAIFGPDSPQAIMALGGLEEYYRGHCLDAKAEAIAKRTAPSKAKGLAACIAKMEQRWGPQHPQVADSLVRLAGYYRSMNQLDEAERSYKRALAIIERTGPNKRSARVHEKLAETYRLQDRLADAALEYEQAIRLARPPGSNNGLSEAWFDELASTYDSLSRDKDATGIRAKAEALRKEGKLYGRFCY